MFQNRDALWVVALGTIGDAPPNDLQPPLADGIHLRWVFPPAKGFPWYGYYLFRRPTRREHPEFCIRDHLRGLNTGPWPSNQLPVAEGVLSSDRPFQFTNDFPPAGIAEIDLAERDYVSLKLPAQQPAWQARVSIGFQRDGDGVRQCVNLRRDHPSQTPNPLTKDEVTLTSFDYAGALPQRGRLVQINGFVGWDVGFSTEIKLPCPASRVELTVAQSSQPAKAEALDSQGRTVDKAAMVGNGPEVLTMRGSDITHIRIVAPQDETILIEICWTCDERPESKATVPIRVVNAGVTVASAVVSGAPGDVVETVLTADAVDEVIVGSGPASLIDICVSRVSDGFTSGWRPLADFEYPLCLPASHADYPCPGAPTAWPTQKPERCLAYSMALLGPGQAPASRRYAAASIV